MKFYSRETPGVLVAIGGADDKASDLTILRRAISPAPGDRHVVGVLMLQNLAMATLDRLDRAGGGPDHVADAVRQVLHLLDIAREPAPMRAQGLEPLGAARVDPSAHLEVHLV